jgi:hypothetical protein
MGSHWFRALKTVVQIWHLFSDETYRLKTWRLLSWIPLHEQMYREKVALPTCMMGPPNIKHLAWSRRLSICMPWQIILHLWWRSAPVSRFCTSQTHWLLSSRYTRLHLPKHRLPPEDPIKFTHSDWMPQPVFARSINYIRPRFNDPMTHRVHLYGRVSASVKSPVVVGVCMPSQIVFRQPYSTSGVPIIFTNNAGMHHRWWIGDCAGTLMTQVLFWSSEVCLAAPTLACIRTDFVSRTFMIDRAATTDNPAARLLWVSLHYWWFVIHVGRKWAPTFRISPY